MYVFDDRGGASCLKDHIGVKVELELRVIARVKLFST